VIALREALQIRRRHFLAGLLVVLLGLSVAWAHGGMGERHMSPEPLDDAITVCLAVAQTAGPLLAGALALSIALRRPRAPLSPSRAPADAPPRPRLTPLRPRAGPVALQVLLR